jgi:hypothetical protein
MNCYQKRRELGIDGRHLNAIQFQKKYKMRGLPILAKIELTFRSCKPIAKILAIESDRNELKSWKNSTQFRLMRNDILKRHQDRVFVELFLFFLWCVRFRFDINLKLN